MLKSGQLAKKNNCSLFHENIC